MQKNQLIKAYRQMLLARRLEERCANSYGMGLIAGFCHLYIGQEAVAVGIKSAITQIDHLVTSYRCHVHAMLFGETPKAILAELFGKKDGSSKGKGGSMHIFSPENNFWGGHGIVGVPATIGTGIAFAQKYNKSNAVVLACYGDGAADQGQVYESFNMASMWNLPIIYVIENNHYSMGTCTARHSAVSDNYYKSGSYWGIEGEKINGMDFIEVYQKTKNIVEKVRDTSRPYIIEFDTYRYKGHSMSDPAKYRTKEEVDNVKKNNDCIINMQNYLLQNSILSQEESDIIENQVLREIDEAYQFAISSQEPDIDDLYKDIII
jgi:pyruvate dehydrogenase E1 component alpha subunit